MNPEIFPDRLKSARLIKGWSLRELAARIGGIVSINSLSRYEKGIMLPGEDIFTALCEALEVPSSFFDRPVVNLKEVEFRKLTKLSLKKQNQIREDAADFLSRYVELEKIMGISQRFVNPFSEKPVINGRDDIERYIKELRKLWKIGTDPIHNVTELLESKDLKVQEISVDEKFDGMTAMADYEGETHYIIVINTFDRPAVRKRFTCLHELAHLLFDFSKISTERDKENLCHHAAGAMLLPEPELKRFFGEKRKSINIRELVTVKEQAGISLGAILFRAQYFGIVSESYAKNQFKFFSIKKRRNSTEPGNYCVPEQSNRMTLLLYRGIEEGIISVSKAAHLSGMTTEEFLESPII